MSDKKEDAKPEKKDPVTEWLKAEAIAARYKDVVLDPQPFEEEAEAIVAVMKALTGLDRGGVQRVLNYARERVQGTWPNGSDDDLALRRHRTKEPQP